MLSPVWVLVNELGLLQKLCMEQLIGARFEGAEMNTSGHPEIMEIQWGKRSARQGAPVALCVCDCVGILLRVSKQVSKQAEQTDMGLLPLKKDAHLGCVGSGSQAGENKLRLLPCEMLWLPRGSGTVSDQENDYRGPQVWSPFSGLRFLLLTWTNPSHLSLGGQSPRGIQPVKSTFLADGTGITCGIELALPLLSSRHNHEDLFHNAR